MQPFFILETQSCDTEAKDGDICNEEQERLELLPVECLLCVVLLGAARFDAIHLAHLHFDVGLDDGSQIDGAGAGVLFA